ncbi:leucine-rich repeat protein kinase family protein [Artemisia annua]|uniref:non-specific serine/threonine protein kinase n=1 Tax=Artemisia annua TaxID=35608 RepID=A0A2U1PYD1_ARTAN|nr:leucine-rich repeat protein kinase family protein [Artemisia annua]
MSSKLGKLLLILVLQVWFSTAQNDDDTYANFSSDPSAKRLVDHGYEEFELKFVIVVLKTGFSVNYLHDDDAATYLRALKDGWQNTPPNWDDNSDPCSGWDGIRCTNSRITAITLASMNLVGGLTGDIGQLTELEILDLSYNQGLTGSLTPAIGRLRNLRNLLLVNCRFSGPLPDTLGDLENLVYMSLNSNGFTGGIPPSIGNLENLYWLDLADNRLTGGIPVSNRTTPGLDMLVNAKHFHFGRNRLSGPIPEELFHSNMTLIHLLLENNLFNGPIPSSLGLVESLEVVRLDRNAFSGTVPSSINSLTGLFEMFLSNNQLTGTVPNLSRLNAIYYLNMFGTNLVGQLPAALFDIPQLQNVDLSNNQLNGTLNISSTHSNQLQQVNLQNNQIGDFAQRNQYTIQLILAGNPICTESGVTDRFCSPPTNTNSSYSTPSNCNSATCSNSGQVSSPNCRCAFPYTGFLNFRAPSFSDLGNSTIWESLRNSMISSFRLSQLPVDSVALRNPTKNLDDYLVITLQVFPSGDDRFNRTGILGLGFSLSNQTFKPPADFGTYFFIGENYDFLTGGASGGGSNSSNTGVIVGSVIGGCVLLALLVVAGLYAFRQKGRAERATNESSPFALWDATNGSGAIPQLKGVKAFTFAEVSKYTNNFSETNNIGTGGYGMVYRGSLPNGQLIAIKRAKQGSTQGGLEFKTEIELLSRVHHKNLVSLVGFCFDQGEQMLVYEYIVNGTVKDSLSGSFLVDVKIGSRQVLDPTIGLTTQLKGLERFVDIALRCVEERGDTRPTMSDVVKEIESIMELAGFNPNAESAANSSNYDYASKGSEHPYTNDNLFAYSGDHFSAKLDPK